MDPRPNSRIKDRKLSNAKNELKRNTKKNSIQINSYEKIMNYDSNDVDYINKHNEKNIIPERNRILLAKRELKMPIINTKNNSFYNSVTSELNQMENETISEEFLEQNKVENESIIVEKEKTPEFDENRENNSVILTFTAHIEIKNIDNDILKILLIEIPTHVQNDVRTRSASFSSFPFSSNIPITKNTSPTSTSFSTSFYCPKKDSYSVRNILYEREILVKDAREIILSKKVRYKVIK